MNWSYQKSCHKYTMCSMSHSSGSVLRPPEEPLPHQEIELQPDLTYVEQPSKILAENWKRLRNRAIKYCKVQWKNHPAREATWEMESELRKDYPYLFRYVLSIPRTELL